jgi:hypothetical protein
LFDHGSGPLTVAVEQILQGTFHDGVLTSIANADVLGLGEEAQRFRTALASEA